MRTRRHSALPAPRSLQGVGWCMTQAVQYQEGKGTWGAANGSRT